MVPRMKHTLTMLCERFEAQLTAVKERLEAAKVGSTRGLASSVTNGTFNTSGAGSRIAKPLRGGGGDINGGAPLMPTVANLQAQDGGKQRAGWFFK